LALLAAGFSALAACGSSAPAAAVKPTYDAKTGKLTELTADRDGDGHVDMWAQMDGVHLKTIQIDRHATGHPDRWEYYVEGTAAAGSPVSAGAALDRKTVIDRADEANGPDDKTVTRHEYYAAGVLARVEEDTDFDGKIDKWETYEHGTLARADFDNTGRGKADRRFVYRADGAFDHVEVDPAGDGHFVPATPVNDPATAAAAAKTARASSPSKSGGTR
jgi:hypothetical protein